jgi:peptide/nickel transport system ATP-binding protein
LIASAPDPHRIQGSATAAAAATPEDRGGGEPPSLIDPPEGCRFHPRCPTAMPRCATASPPRLPVDDRTAHWAACWLYDPDNTQTPGSAAGVVRAVES